MSILTSLAGSTSWLSPSLRLSLSIRSFASVSSTTPPPPPPPPATSPFEVFDRQAKRKQKDRAARQNGGESSRVVDYLKTEVAERMLDRYEDLRNAPPLILDLSASSGHLSKALGTLEAVKKIHMTDMSEGSLFRDKDEAFDLAPTRQVIDEEKLLESIPENSQECILSNLGMHWINDLPGALKQIKTALKPDGVFIGAMLGGDTLFELRTALQLAEQERLGGISPRVSPMADPTDCSNLMGRAGFNLLTVDVEDITVSYPSIWELMDDLKAMGEGNAILGRKNWIGRDTLIAADAIYRELHGLEDGSIPATFSVIYLIGWKPAPTQPKPLARGSGKTNLKDVLGSPGDGRLFHTSARTIRSPFGSSTNASRSFSTFRATSSAAEAPAPVKVPIALIAELRKKNPISLSKAREALSKSNLSVSAALEWLERDASSSGGAKKLAKVGSRETKEGLIGVCLMGNRAGMVELRCETDFVGRNEVFRGLVESVAGTTTFLDSPGTEGRVEKAGDAGLLVDFPVDELVHAPVIPMDPSVAMIESNDVIGSGGSLSSLSTPSTTITQAITSAITQTGENIQLSRAITFSVDGLRENSDELMLPGVYVHGSVKSGGNEGKVGGLVVIGVRLIEGGGNEEGKKGGLMSIIGKGEITNDLKKMARTLARQVVGFPTKGIRTPSSSSSSLTSSSSTEEEIDESSSYLMKQPFMMHQGESRSVEEVLEEWGRERRVVIEVKDMRRWSVGE